MKSKAISLLVCLSLCVSLIPAFTLFTAVSAPADVGVYGWGLQNPLPYGHGLRTVWGSSSNDIFAVGDRGTILHYDGSTWAKMGIDTTDYLTGVWGTSSSNVFVVGSGLDGASYSGGHIFHYDGVTWSDLGISGSDLLADIWGSSEDDIFAVGSGGTVLHFDGTTWNTDNVGSTCDLLSVWGSSAEDVYAVGGWTDDTGQQHGVAFHYDNDTWSQEPIGEWEYLMDVWGTSATDVFIAGWNDGVILHYDGSAWTPMDTGTEKSFSGLWGTSSNDVYAVGAAWDGSGWYGSAMHYDGMTWNPMSLGQIAYLNGVWGSSSSDVFAVGQSGTIVHFDGTWTEMMPSGVTENLYDVWVASPTDVYAVGGWWDGMIQHYDGTAWTPMTEDTNETLTGIWGSSASDIFAVGHWGAVLHYDGDVWTTWDTGTTAQLSEVWGSSSTDVFVVGGQWDGSQYTGVLFHYDGVSGSQMDVGTTGYLNSIWGSSSIDVFAAGGETILHYDGSDWSPMVCDGAEGLRGVWGSSSEDVFVVGGSWGDDSQPQGTIFHYDGSEWSLMKTVDNSLLYSIWGTSPSNVFAVGYGGTILHYDGVTWTSMSNCNTSGLTSVCGSSSDVFAVGYGGTIVHYPEISTLAATNPTQGYQGHTMSVTISGSNLSDATAVSFGSGIDVNGFTINNVGQISAKISINGTASLGVRDVGVTLPAGVAIKAGGFTVLDGSPPSTPVVTDDEATTNNNAELHASWTSTDNESGIAEYQYGIGTSAGATDTVNWTSAGLNTEVTETGLSLAWGSTYYFSVKASNGTGLWSAVGNSNGIMVSDATPPSTPVVTDDGATTFSTSQLHARWASSDTESGIAECRYAIGTTSGGTDILGWTSMGTNTQVTKPGLNLNIGTTYYFSVKAMNGADLWSEIGVSDGIGVIEDPTPPTTPAVTDDSATTTNTGQLHATWSSTDAESGIAEYQYAIGTTAGGIDVVGWTSFGKNTEVTRTGLSLTWGTTYFFSIKAKNGLGAWSSVGASDGITLTDVTSPAAPVVTDDGATTSEPNQLHATWSASDPESGIAEYQYAIGTTAGGTDVVGWTSTGASGGVTHTRLSLAAGTKHFISVKAKNGAGQWSDTGVSNGITVTAEDMAVEDIPPAGGTVQTADGRITAEFPANTAVGELTVTIEDVEPPSDTSTPQGFKAGNTYFVIEITDASGNPVVTLSQPITITVKYSDEDVAAAGGDPDDLVLAYYDEAAGEWNPLTTTVSTADKTLSASTKHLSTWGVLVKAAKSNGTPFWIWIIVGVGAVAVFGSGILLWRRITKKPVATG